MYKHMDEIFTLKFVPGISQKILPLIVLWKTLFENTLLYIPSALLVDVCSSIEEKYNSFKFSAHKAK